MVKKPPATQESWSGKILWRREQLPTPVFWPGEFYGQRSLAGYSPWCCKESDRTERFSLILSQANVKLWESKLSSGLLRAVLRVKETAEIPSFPPGKGETEKKKKRMQKVSGFHCLQLSGICLCFLEKSTHKKVSEAKSLSHVRLFATPWTVAYKASPSMGFSK